MYANALTMRRTIIIAVAILAVGGLLVYLYFATGTPSVTVAPNGGVTLPGAGKGTLPAGSTGTTGTGTGSVAGGGSVSTSPVSVTGQLVEISAGPVVPGVIVTDVKAKNASSSPDVVVRFIERESGNVFSYAKSTGTVTRINNKTLPGIESASWLPNASLAFVQYLSGSDLSTINTYALPAATSTGGFFLSQNLTGLAVSSTSVLTLVSGVNGSIATLQRTDGTKPSTLFTTPLTALRISFAGKNQYLAFSKPSATLAGHAFIVDSTGRFSRVVGPLSGLTALASPAGKWLLVSYVNKGALQTELVNIATGATTALPIGTIADKCVWTTDDTAVYCGVPQNPDAAYSYPDDWYQGAVHFSDRIWKIDVTGRFAQLILDFSQAKSGDLDAETLAIDPAGSMLVFVNKNDGSVWSYSL